MEELCKKIQADRDRLEESQRDMEQRLFQVFSTWDDLQNKPGQGDPQVRKEKDQALREMREILSNRTYLRHVVEDLSEADATTSS